MSAGFGSDLIEQVELSTLVGEMPEIACEAITHSDPLFSDWHDEGPAKFYVRLGHDCTIRGAGYTYPACAAYASRLRRLSETHSDSIWCVTCQRNMPARDWGWIVGPVGK